MKIDKYLSVVVPVYNVEAYLHQCIGSIKNQTFKDLEIILINDGSTDSSGKICDEYSNLDSRIRVLHQENAGVSAARNSGIALASGDYITFVDSDDWLDANMYEEMWKVSESSLVDLVMCDFKNIKQNSTEIISSNIRKGFYNKQQIIKELYPTLLVTENFGRIPIVSIWNSFFKRKLFTDNNIRFDADLRYSEDYLFMADVVVHADSFFYLKGNYAYNYRQYEESRSKKFQPVWWENLLYLNKELKKLLNNNKEYDFSRQIKLQLLHSVLFVLNSISKNKTMNAQSKLREIRSIMNHPAVAEAFSTLSFNKGSKMLRLVLYSIKYKMVRAYLLLHQITSIRKNG